jgi:hypothetical protein
MAGDRFLHESIISTMTNKKRAGVKTQALLNNSNNILEKLKMLVQF